ncbi:UDP binding domain-containing protein, partial [Chelatococcus reniformis]|uniref:UDP-glucose 6-dehydrogenase n=1 Tax=Chelatococcus reniformis TaxID=1494448 RepID=A0A916XFB5_9HYPH
MEQAQHLLEAVTYAEDPYSCATGADALVIVTEWDPFRALDLAELKRVMKAPVIVDLRNIYPSDEIAEAGLIYRGIGRPHAPSAPAPDKA